MYCVVFSLIPRLCVGEEEREPGTFCSCMHQVPLVTCILLCYTKINGNFCLPAERPHCRVWNNIALTVHVTVCIASLRWSVNFKGKHCVSHGHSICGHSCKRRAEYLRHSPVIVCTEHSQWQASFIREKLACLVEVSVTAGFMEISKNPGGTEHAQTVCTML